MREAAGRLPSTLLEAARTHRPPARSCSSAWPPWVLVRCSRTAAGESAPPSTVCASSSSEAASSRAPRGLDGAPGGEVDHAADGDRDGHEEQQGQQLPRLLDGERVQRRGEVPVEQQAGRHGGEHGGPEAAQDRDRHHRDQVDEQVVGQVQVRPQAASTEVSSGRRRRRAPRPPRAGGADGADRAGRPPSGRGRGVRRRPGRGPLGGGAAGAHARIGTHAYQCESSEVPAEHQAEAGAGQRARADDEGGVGGGRPGRPQLRIGRPGEPHRGEPADAGQQDRRDRLGGERHGPGDRRAGDQHPGRGQAAVQRGGHRAHGQEHGEADRQRKGRRYRALSRAVSHPLLFQPRYQAISAVLTEP